jgi:nucleoside-diphosphate-sugar epimerase
MTRSSDGLVLVTGGEGFAGSYVARELLGRGRPVCTYGHGRLSPEWLFVLGGAADTVTIERGSIDDLPRLVEVVKDRRPAAIVHLAGIVDTVALSRNPYLAFRMNLQGALNVFEAARLFDVERVINVSSIGVLPTIQYEPIDAAHPIILAKEGPGSGAYGAAKAASELFAFAYGQAYGLDVRTIRPSAIYGFGMRSHSANYMKQFVEPAVRGEAVRLLSGGPLPRDYTHILDMATLTAAVLEGPDDADRIFFAATGESLVTAAEAARIVVDLIPGASIEVADVLGPDDLIETAFRGVLSVENARVQLGWQPAYRSLREGIREYIGRYRAFLNATSGGAGER